MTNLEPIVFTEAFSWVAKEADGLYHRTQI